MAARFFLRQFPFRTVLSIAIALFMAGPTKAQKLEWRLKKPQLSKAQGSQPLSPSGHSAVPSSVPGITDGQDIQVFPSSNPQSEVHVSINKFNPLNLIISANTHTSIFSQGRYKSNDGGLTWSGADELNPGVSVGGDPSTAFDTNGNTYISTILSNSSGYGVVKALNNSNTWSNLINDANISPGDQFDKEMIAVDNTISSVYANNLYCAWSDFSIPVSVKFNRSTDGAATFSTPINLKTGTQQSTNAGQGTNVQTGPNGEVYVCFADYGVNGNYPASGLGFVRSTDGGNTFTVSKVAFPYTGISLGNGPNRLFNNTRVNDFPSMSVDKSCGSRRGRIYAVYATKQNGTGKAVIQFNSSDDRGDTWSASKEISIAVGSQNWFPWVAVDDATGAVYVVYYSFDNATQYSTNTYVAISTDGGTTFQNQKVSDVSHITSAINNNIFASGYAGDYIGIATYGSKAFASWMDNKNGTWQVYFSELTNMSTSVDPICTSATFTVNNLPPGFSVSSWSANNGSLALSGPTSNSVVATKVNGGFGYTTVTATVSSGCGTTYTISKTAWVGTPDQPGSISGNTSPNIGYTELYFSASLGQGATSSNWILPYNSKGCTYCWSIYNYNDALSIYAIVGSDPGFVQAVGVNACGAGGAARLYVTPTGTPGCNPCQSPVKNGTSLFVYPNPAKDILNVNVTDSLALDQPLGKAYELNIMDRFSKKVFSAQSSEKVLEVPVGHLPPGIYYLNLFYKDAVLQRQIVITR